jgi:DNA polymerase V
MSQFPSPARDFLLNDLNLDTRLRPNRPASAIRRMHKYDDSMVDAGIMPNSIMVIDNSLDPQDGDPVYAIVDREKLVRSYYFRKTYIELLAENEIKKYPPTYLYEGGDWEIVGVVRASVIEFK